MIHGTEHMDDAEYWQRIALEAYQNNDHAKAFAIRYEEFSGNEVYPRQRDTVIVYDSNQNVFEFLASSDFEFDSVETMETNELDDGNTKVKVEGLKYTHLETRFGRDK